MTATIHPIRPPAPNATPALPAIAEAFDPRLTDAEVLDVLEMSRAWARIAPYLPCPA